MRAALFHPKLIEDANKLAEDFQSNVTQDDLPILFNKVDEEGRKIFSQFLEGIELYRAHPYRRDVDTKSIFWQEGTTTLQEFKSPNGNDFPPVLIIPSLVNKSYILDLSSEHSFCRYLQSKGHPVYLVDWGFPNTDEKNFSLEDYILRLERIAEFLRSKAGTAPNIIGYCMGGTLATGLAAYNIDLASKIVLLATPWDFTADGGQQTKLLQPGLPIMKNQISSYGQLPTDSLQLCFGLLDSMLALKKFARFSKMDQTSPQALSFVALEDWLNDGVPLAGPTALECLEGWYQNNTPGRGNWIVKGKNLLPRYINIPCLCIAPQADRIVPPETAIALHKALPKSHLMSPPLGHIGMMSSKRAVEMVWKPIDNFLR